MCANMWGAWGCTDKVDEDLGSYLSQNETKHNYRETPTEQLVRVLNRIIHIRAAKGVDTGCDEEEDTKSTLLGTQLASLITSKHAMETLINLLNRGKYYRHMRNFLPRWFMASFLGTYGGVSGICFKSGWVGC